MGLYALGTLILATILPAGIPVVLSCLFILLELLAYITRTLSIGLRLTVNMITGHLLVILICATIMLPLLFIFILLEYLIAYLQAYIFTFIVIFTLHDILYSG